MGEARITLAIVRPPVHIPHLICVIVRSFQTAYSPLIVFILIVLLSVSSHAEDTTNYVVDPLLCESPFSIARLISPSYYFPRSYNLLLANPTVSH